MINWTIEFFSLNNPQVCLFEVCLFEVFRPTRDFFSHMEMSPLPVKGSTF